ncbi:hypothetical protein GGR21_003675 [Dysgonomonas hofstadii]|uniref:Uncharacterized protein n=1 Tax=Dysgonomonas hofstadii TaxID=637886 RepID=A0A840CVS8_9BACT|nr:hypothetical protein [Dysgonomonas hofstadii]
MVALIKGQPFLYLEYKQMLEFYHSSYLFIKAKRMK